MVRGQFRSRTFRRIFRRTPGGKSVLRYLKRKTSQPVCAETGQVLPGVARGSEVKKLTRSQRKPNRPFAGILSSKAARRAHIRNARE